MRRQVPPDTLELSVGPHPARVAWSILRVTYPDDQPHRDRVARALDALLTEAAHADGVAAVAREVCGL